MKHKECLIRELKRLKESSKEAVENLNSFGEFKDYMHVKRKVQEELVEIIEQADQSSKPQLILVCGGVGDGKSHLISYLKKHRADLLDDFDMHNDATESFEPQKTSLETLNDVLDNFSDEKINKSKTKYILAINLGALNNFIDSEYKDRFEGLREYVRSKGILESSVGNNEFDSKSNFQFINFSDYHMYSLTEEGPKSEYIEELIQKIVNIDEKNIFRNTYNDNCIQCENSYKCPVKFNYEMLMDKEIQRKLSDLIIEAIVKNKMIVSTRALLNFIYDSIVNVHFDNMTFNQINSDIEKLRLIDVAKYMITSNLFEHSELSSILNGTSELDPMKKRNEDLDNIIIKLNTTDDITTIFRKHIDMEGSSYLENVILKKQVFLDEINSIKTKRDQEIVTDELIKLFVRLYLFKSNNQEICLQDNIYNQYMEDLYWWNRGQKNKLKRLYSDVKESIYKWNGENLEGNINIFIGKNQMRYRTSQKLDIRPDIASLELQEEENLFKFNPNLNLKFINKDKDKKYEIDIDYNLYKLLMAVKRGYRPNKVDKYNCINFVEFINKILRSGNHTEEIVIEDKFGDGNSRYKLEYDSDFDSYKFERINGV